MSAAHSRRAIGGDFELSIPSLGTPDKLQVLTGDLAGTWTTSGRGALALVLQELKTKGVTKVLLPAYLCESILLPIRQMGFAYSFYPVDAALIARPEPEPDSATMIIDYFGWINPASLTFSSQPDSRSFVIEDACQAFLNDWHKSAGSRFIVTSPRKFAPAMLGGWCNITSQIEPSSCELELVAWRSLAARLARGAYLGQPEAPANPEAEKFYLTLLGEVEVFLDTHPTATALPRIVLDLIAGIDWSQVATRRRENWQALHELIGDKVEAPFASLPETVVPLGYVVRLKNRDEVRDRLAAQRIFCPIHWLLPAEISRSHFPEAVSLSETCLTLPIDQRYNSDDISRLADALLSNV